MAKKKTPQDLIEEAKKIMMDARRKQASLIQEAKDLENKKLIELGKKCVEFLSETITKDELIVQAKKLELFEDVSSSKEVEEVEEVEEELEVDTDV